MSRALTCCRSRCSVPVPLTSTPRRHCGVAPARGSLDRPSSLHLSRGDRIRSAALRCLSLAELHMTQASFARLRCASARGCPNSYHRAPRLLRQQLGERVEPDFVGTRSARLTLTRLRSGEADGLRPSAAFGRSR